MGVTGFAVEPVELYARVRFRTAYPEVSWSFRIGPRGAIYGFGCNDHSRADPAEVKAAEEAIARVLWKDAPSFFNRSLHDVGVPDTAVGVGATQQAHSHSLGQLTLPRLATLAGPTDT